MTSAYSAMHPSSPLARGWDVAGPVRVTDRLRADVEHAVSRTMWRRAYGLGLISVSTGVVADEHQVETGLWLDDCQNPADYLVRWIVTGCEWHETGGTSVVEPTDAENADRAERYALECAGDVESYGVELMRSDVTPVWFVEWCARLVHLPKLDYLYALGSHEWLSGPDAVDPGTAWSGKVARQFVARCRK